MTTLRYKGFDILPRPYQLTDSKLWTIDLEIRRYGARQPFSLDERHQSEEAAAARCSVLGRRIVDGEVPGWSVDHLRAHKPELRRPLFITGLVILVLGLSLFLSV